MSNGMPSGVWSTLHSFRRDPSVTQQRLAPGTVRRITGYAKPYWRSISMFLVLVVVDAMLVIASPLLFKRIIDDGVAQGDKGLVVRLALIVALIAVVDSLIGKHVEVVRSESTPQATRLMLGDHSHLELG